MGMMCVVEIEIVSVFTSIFLCLTLQLIVDIVT
jgi:hypothetical protein